MESRLTSRTQERLIPALTKIRERAVDRESALQDDLAQIEADYRDSARNLMHYLSVRQQDLRKLQDDLSSLGLSSLGRMEAHVMASLNAVLDALVRLAGKEQNPASPVSSPVSFRMGPMLLEDHTKALLGRDPGNRSVRIMVTMPSEAASSPELLERLLYAGMDVMRINCAHDDPIAWKAMISNLRRAERRHGKRCRVLADLSGPKLRTGRLESVEPVVKIRPKRDYRGRVVKPALVWVTPAHALESAPQEADATLPASGEISSKAQTGDWLDLQDTRGKFRRLQVIAKQGASLLAELRQTTYVPEGALLRIANGDAAAPEAQIRGLPSLNLSILLSVDDPLILTHSVNPGSNAKRDESGQVIEPARIGCSLDAVFDSAKPGEPIWFDDGKIGGLIEANDGVEVKVRITHARPQGSRLLADKGINLPETDLQVPALTNKDIENLALLVEDIDMVGLSFVRRAEDVIQLEDRLHALGAGHLGIVLKIENRVAFENLPKLLIAGLKSPPVGVMVARGDLAVELGFERLSEVQEEILWVCEAAHVPVIWATQVLEDMAKTGMPSRAEVTDAAMSGRAECVMLNKGPYIVEAVDFLNGVLERMEKHQSKKSAMLRKLSISVLS